MLAGQAKATEYFLRALDWLSVQAEFATNHPDGKVSVLLHGSCRTSRIHRNTSSGAPAPQCVLIFITDYLSELREHISHLFWQCR